MQFLEKNEYHTDDPYVKEIINQEIRKELAINLGQNDPEDAKTKKGKSAQQQTLMNLKSDGEKFKYLWSQEGIEDIDYEEEEDDLRRNKEMKLIEPLKYQVLGYVDEKGSQKKGRLRRRPILRMTDLYLTSNPKMKRLINHVFDRHIYGKTDNKKVTNQNIITSNCASNSNQLEQILKKYQNNEEDYNFQNLQLKLDQNQLEDYIIDHNQSKSNYFLFYKHEHPIQQIPQVINHPLASNNFLQRLYAQVGQLQARARGCDQIEDQGRDIKKDWQQKKIKDYFGQFKKNSNKGKAIQKYKIKDNFNDEFSSKHQVAKKIFDFYSYVDNDLIQESYKKSLPDNDRLELNLNSPYFFQTKLHTIMNKQREIIRDEMMNADYKTNFNIDPSHLSLDDKGFKHISALQNQRKDDMADQAYEDNTIQKVIQAQIRNVYKEPLKHSDVATKFQYVKFTLEEECFNLYHKFYFGFHEHLHSGKTKVELVQTKRRKDKPNRLIINSEMKQSNEKFSHKEDLSLANKDEFIVIQYIQETPLLMSDVGMCERMIIQVNHQKILETINNQSLHNKSLEQMEQEIQQNKPAKLTFDIQCQLWRKKIKDLFGPNGKQYFWDPKKDGKLIGIPQGPGVAIMENNLFNIPIVKKKVNPRDYLLVRDGKKWVLRKIDWMYVSGQTEPNIKVFCPGSRQHTEFKLSYQKAFVIKQIKQYGSVNFDLLKLTFKGQTQNSLRKALKNANAISKDSKNYKLSSESVKNTLIDLSAEDVCIYQRMQKSLCQLKQVGISQIKSNEKMKNVLKEFNRKHFLNQEKITIARMIRQQLQLTSWYLTDSFLKYKQKASKIEINGFADPTNGKGGYSYINKPQKQRTSKQDMEEKVEKNRLSEVRDLRKLKVDASKELLRQMGHNQDQIQEKGRWALINVLKNKQGTQYSRRQRQTKFKKIENEKKDISKNFNRLLYYLHDKTEDPAFEYKGEKKNKLANFMARENQYWQKIKRKYSKPIQEREENRSQDSDQDDD